MLSKIIKTKGGKINELEKITVDDSHVQRPSHLRRSFDCSFNGFDYNKLGIKFARKTNFNLKYASETVFWRWGGGGGVEFNA